jgi:hypothetical protein
MEDWKWVRSRGKREDRCEAEEAREWRAAEGTEGIGEEQRAERE